MRARVMPGVTDMPARTPSSSITPPIGALIVITARGSPERSTCAICASVIPSSSSRSRAAAVSSASPVCLTARYSCWAPAHSVTSTSASGAPAWIDIARCTRIHPLHEPAGAGLHDGDVALVEPDGGNGADTRADGCPLHRRHAHAEALRQRRIDPHAAAASSSAYLGTSCMSMKGDLPGLSNFCCGYMGSYQYSGWRSP